MSLGPLNPNLVLEYTNDVTNRIGTLGAMYTQNREMINQNRIQNERSDFNSMVNAGNLMINAENSALARKETETNMMYKAQDREDAKQKATSQAEFQQQLKQAAQAGIPGIKSFYIKNGLAKEALELDKAEKDLRKMDFDMLKAYSDLDKLLRKKGTAQAISSVINASDNPELQQQLYNNLRLNLASMDGIQLPAELTPAITIVLSQKVAASHKLDAQLFGDMQLATSNADILERISSQDGQKQINEIAAQYVSESGSGQFVNPNVNVSSSYNPAKDPLKMLEARASARVPTNTTAQSEAEYQAQLPDYLRDTSTMNAEPGISNRVENKIKDLVKQGYSQNEAEAEVYGQENVFNKSLQGAPILQGTVKTAESDKSSNQDLRQILIDPNADKALKVKALDLLYGDKAPEKQRAGVLGLIDEQAKLIEKANNGDEAAQTQLSIVNKAIEKEITPAQKKGLTVNVNTAEPTQDLTITNVNKIQEQVAYRDSTISRLEDVIAKAKPESLTYRGRAMEWAAIEADKLGVSGDAQKELIKRAEEFKPEVRRMLADYVKSLSGATVTEQEFKRKVNEFVAAELSPTQFFLRAENLISDMQKLNNIDKERLTKGLNVEPTQEQSKASKLKSMLSNFTKTGE